MSAVGKTALQQGQCILFLAKSSMQDPRSSLLFPIGHQLKRSIEKICWISPGRRRVYSPRSSRCQRLSASRLPVTAQHPDFSERAEWQLQHVKRKEWLFPPTFFLPTVSNVSHLWDTFMRSSWDTGFVVSSYHIYLFFQCSLKNPKLET